MKTLLLLLAFTIVGCQTPKDVKKYKKASNGEFLTISGKVTEVFSDSFILKVNDKDILVEMDDFDIRSEGYNLKVKDNVVVYGRIDNDFLEKKKIEAGTVYVKNIDTHFFANDADEEDTARPMINYNYYDLSKMVIKVRGRVIDINKDQFRITTGEDEIDINIKKLKFNPLDNIGLTQIDKNDYVEVIGVIDGDYVVKKDLTASVVREL